MEHSYNIRKYAVDKIAFLGLLIASLLVARLVTTSRLSIKLSGPIKSTGVDLLVSMPNGNGWHSEDRWRFRNNAFFLSSVFAVRSGGVMALAHCRYFLAAEKNPPDTQFERKASALGGAVEEKGKIQTGSLVVNWAHIRKQKTPFELFFGTAELPNGRQINIEVFHPAEDEELAEEVFKLIVASLKYQDDQLLGAGGKIVSKIKDETLKNLAGNDKRYSQKETFLIKNEAKQDVGFAIDTMLINSPDSNKPGIQSANYYYIRSRFEKEQVAYFQGNNDLTEFIWKGEVSGAEGAVGTEVTLDSNGAMTIGIPGSATEEEKYYPGPASIPDIFAEFAFAVMLDSDCREIILDVIQSDGTIVPTLISRIEIKNIPADENFACAFKVEFLNGQGYSEKVYLDGNRQVVKILLQQENLYIIERAEVQDIFEKFPRQGESVLQKKLLD
jgi:hypothetical protein